VKQGILISSSDILNNWIQYLYRLVTVELMTS
jgi:hypothetical protein